jgi:hypothetical protein
LRTIVAKNPSHAITDNSSDGTALLGGMQPTSDVDRQKVRNSPPYDPSKTVDDAYDETFLTYYGIRWTHA